MYGIFAPDGARLGTVAKFVGHPTKERWVAWSTTEPVGSDHKFPAKRFPTKRAAVAWLIEVAASAPTKQDQECTRDRSPQCD